MSHDLALKSILTALQAENGYGMQSHQPARKASKQPKPESSSQIFLLSVQKLRSPASPVTRLTEVVHMFIRPVRPNASITKTPAVRIAAWLLATSGGHVLCQNSTHAHSGSRGHRLNDMPELCVRKLVDVSGRGCLASSCQFSRLR